MYLRLVTGGGCSSAFPEDRVNALLMRYVLGTLCVCVCVCVSGGLVV